MTNKNFQKLIFALIILPLYMTVKLWQFIRPVRESLGLGKCRFYPSCSDYLLGAMQLHGLIKGSILTVKRIARCNPLCEGGIDKVPL